MASSKSAPIHLPEILDSSAASALREVLLAQRGEALVIHADGVERISTPCLQVLMSAAATWLADGVGFAISGPSAMVVETVALLGISREQLPMEQTTT